MGRSDYIFGQFRETVQHGDTTACIAYLLLSMLAKKFRKSL